MHLATIPEESSHFNNSLPALNRRRSLFPTEVGDSDSDSDLGHISPLNFDSNFEKDTFGTLGLKQSQKPTKTVGDYDIIGVVENWKQIECTPQGKHSQVETMSPLYLSPYYNKREMTTVVTPKSSPFFKLKTPHDAPNTNSKLPKLTRKSLLDYEVSSNSSKRKLSPDNSPDQSKHIKIDPKSCRVRTTLFPEVDFAFSTKSFYPKSEDIMSKIKNKSDSLPKSSVLFSANRKGKLRKKIGQINAGVRHKIRKPKPKTINKRSLVKDALNSMGNVAITEYIMDLKELKSSDKQPKLIATTKENTETTQTVVQSTEICNANKENLEPPQKLIQPALIPEKKIEPKKRPLSPESEPNTNKRFFKSSRSKGVVKMNKNIQLEINHGKISLVGEDKNKSKNNFDMSDLNFDDSDSSNTNIDDILSCLENEKESIPKENKITLQATNSVLASDNSILLHQPACAADLILSPISQMCDVTSGLALNTPKKVRNLIPILAEMDNQENATDDEKQRKLFPVFYSKGSHMPAKKEKIPMDADKKFKKLSADQMLLDAGQKKFGITQCHECEFVYHEGDPGDEISHLNYHTGRHILRFSGWRNERVVADLQNDGRIIQIVSGDSKIWWRKAQEMMDITNRELGLFDIEFSLDNCQVFFYIKKKTIVGCLVATPKSEGHMLIDSTDDHMDMCSQKVYPIKCGVARIWVSANNRRRGIASQMMNALKRNFVKGSILSNADLAFTSPSDLGKEFGKTYFKTNNFFVYFV